MRIAAACSSEGMCAKLLAGTIKAVREGTEGERGAPLCERLLQGN